MLKYPAILGVLFGVILPCHLPGQYTTIIERVIPCTPLHIAAKSSEEKWVALLLEKGAHPNVKNRKGQTPLDMAGKKIADLLISKGAKKGNDLAP